VYPPDDRERISRLADEDNENDEYHLPVPLPDIWAEYRRLKDGEGWSGAKIAAAKRQSEGAVSERLRYARFPQAVLDAFFNAPILNERHARELLALSTVEGLAPWLTRDQALAEIVDAVMDKHRSAEPGQAPDARQPAGTPITTAAI
jgi:hypothetical protein